jgi:CheY-like chemotaxis protein
MRSDLRILVVDDEKGSRESVVALLHLLGVSDVSMTRDGAPALELLLSTSGYDLVISDQNMPLMTVLQLLQSIEARGRPEGLRFILLSGEVPPELPRGVDAFLAKPFAPEHLVSHIERLCPS